METAYRLRLYLLTALVLLGFGALLHRLHEVQIEDTQKYRDRVPSPKNVSVREPGVRGEIRDAHGVLLARNSRNYEVSFNIEEIINAYQLQHDDAPFEHYANVSKNLKLDRLSLLINVFKFKVLPRSFTYSRYFTIHC